MTGYDKLKSIIQQANPESYRCQRSFCRAIPCTSEEHRRPIRLADVLHWKKTYYNKLEMYNRYTIDIVEKWNWLDDNLDNQSEETKQFLIELLV